MLGLNRVWILSGQQSASWVRHQYSVEYVPSSVYIFHGQEYGQTVEYKYSSVG